MNENQAITLIDQILLCDLRVLFGELFTKEEE